MSTTTPHLTVVPDARTSEQSDDAVLLAAVAVGCREAWLVLVDRYADLVWDCARPLSCDLEEAQEVSEAVWRRLAQALPLPPAPGGLAVWLLRATTDEASRCRHGR